MAANTSRSRLNAVMMLRARVTNGRIHLDEPTDLPEGTELSVVVDARGDDALSPEEDAGLIAALDSIRARRGVDGATARARLLARAGA